MVKINSEGEYLLNSGAGSIFRKYTQNSRVPPTATVVGDTPPPPFGYKFLGKAELTVAVDAWVVSSTQDDAFKKYGDIQYWDVSEVKDMSLLFSPSRSGVSGTVKTALTSFNGNIRNWDVSNVTNMQQMFINNTGFNQPIGGWNTSSVTNMIQLFRGATTFNQPIGNWDVSNVTNMSTMFVYNKAFDQPLGSWDVSNVTSMAGMFLGATAFMANDANYTRATNGISKWKPTNITAPIFNMFFGIAAPTGVGPKWVALHGTGATTLIDSTTGTVTLTGVAAPPPGTASTGIFYK
jgi:surface protein